jgi:hypothetical protein
MSGSPNDIVSNAHARFDNVWPYRSTKPSIILHRVAEVTYQPIEDEELFPLDLRGA